MGVMAGHARQLGLVAGWVLTLLAVVVAVYAVVVGSVATAEIAFQVPTGTASVLAAVGLIAAIVCFIASGQIRPWIRRRRSRA